MTYDVAVQRDPSGAWLARVPSIPGCHTYGRSLEEVRSRIREALSLWVDDADEAQLRLDIHLPADARSGLAQAQRARERSTQAQREASAAVRQAAADLTDRLGLSRRDAAEILGISHQRVQQLLSTRN